MRDPHGRMALGDRIKTIAITVALTSAAWIVFGLVMGGTVLDRFGDGLATVRRTAPPQDQVTGDQPSARVAAPAHRDTSRQLPAAVAGRYIIPVAGVRADQLTDSFSDARGANTRIHEAIDIMAPTGTPVIAATGGTIERLFESEAGGLTVYVRSPDRRTITYYAHLDAYAPGLTEGQLLRSGQAIGTVGYSGNASPDAPHLHFAIMQTTPGSEWWEPAYPVNPYPVLTGARR